MEIKIIVNTNLPNKSGQISMQTISDINKIKKYKIATEHGYFQVGDIFGPHNFVVEIIRNEHLEKNILYVSNDVKEQFYPDKSILSI